jgi:hypothetical protein
MNKTDMKNAIISKIDKEAGSAANANKKFGDAVLEYIVDNMDITFRWSGTNPASGAQDPVTSFKASLSGSGTLAVSSSFAVFLIALATFIKSSIRIFPATGFILSPLSFNPAGLITASQGKENDPDEAMENICDQIITSLKNSFPSPIPAGGSHGAFTGATTRMEIA